MSIFTKAIEAVEAQLDSVIAKAKSNNATPEVEERKSQIDLSFPEQEQYGWKEKSSMIGTNVLKSMARKDSIIIATIGTRISQITPFCKEPEDRYSPGWAVKPVHPADLTAEQKMQLADPELSEEEYEELNYEFEQERLKAKEQQDKDVEKIKLFLKHCGMSPSETDTTKERWDLPKYIKAVAEDVLTYHYSATELVPTKGGDKVHHFYPVSAGTIRYVSKASSELVLKQMQESELSPEDKAAFDKRMDKTKPFRYVQVVRGRVIAAFTEDDMIFEPMTPTTDPEDNGYSMGPLEKLVQTVTAHLYAEAHNRNFFTQGIGSKGILHIKGENISRGQLEAFKRQWFNQVTNTRNAFRPPIIGMAEDVKWVSLAQTNREMEFEQWMNYLIKITTAVFQIDPAEINFDISKVATSTLNESNNEEKIKSSRDKGLRPLLDYIEDIINNHILRYWDPKLADKYKFSFVGFQAESRSQEIDRLEKETKVWKTLNEARIEMGYAPLEDGNLVLNATYTQYLAQKQMAKQANDPNAMGQDPQGDEDAGEMSGDMSEMDSGLDEIAEQAAKEIEAETKEEQKAAADEAKKSETPVAIEYFVEKKD